MIFITNLSSKMFVAPASAMCRVHPFHVCEFPCASPGGRNFPAMFSDLE